MNIQFLRPQKTSASASAIDELSSAKATPHHIVSPGELITSDPQFMRGHGTYIHDEALTASVAGVVERVNKLVVVRPLKTRYNPEVGDLVVGRITEVQQKRWKVDIHSRQDAVLQLSSITIPGVQRRRTEADELEMRNYFVEGDLVAAEVQGLFSDQSAALQTRNTRFGKLRNGCLVLVPPTLVKRCKSHFHTLPCGVDVILGLNGYIWVCKHSNIPGEQNNTGGGGLGAVNEDSMELLYANRNDDIDMATREAIARVSNCITALAKHYVFINDSIIVYMYDASLQFSIKELLNGDVMSEVVMQAKLQLEQSLQ